MSPRRNASHLISVLGYTLPRLHEGKEWYIDFYSLDPSTGEPRRKKFYIPAMKNKRERRAFADALIERTASKLRIGWNPWVLNENIRSSTPFDEVLDKYLSNLSSSYRKSSVNNYTSRAKILRDYISTLSVPPMYIWHYDRAFVNDFLDWILTKRKGSARTRGYEVKITKNGKHVEDICDCLQGKYRKDFKFMGWHPQCMCYTIPILKTEDEFFDDDEDAKSVNEVEDVPQGFKDWVKDNEGRIDQAAERGKLPYFIADNRDTVKRILEGGSGSDGNRKDDAEAARIEANRREYERLKADPNYADVEFNPKNGGLKATHVEHETHNNDKTLYFGKFKPNDLELMAQNILYNNGYSCILESEMIFNSQGIQQVSLDTTTNSERMDIKSITKNGKNTLKNAIRDKKHSLQNSMRTITLTTIH